MGKPEPFLGKTGTFSEAHPEIKSITVNVEEDGEFPPHFEAHMRKQRFNAGTIPEHLSCRNPKCREGGVDLKQTVFFMSQARETSKQFSHHCRGHEKIGKKKGPVCSNTFDVNVAIEYNAK